MEIQEVSVNGGISNGSVVTAYGNGLDQVNTENGLVQVGCDEKGKGNLAEEVLEDLEEYWDDINDRLMISRMVSDSVIKGMVTAVEQEADERIASKELEVANLKQCLQSHEVRTGRNGGDWLPEFRKAYEGGNYRRFSCFSDVSVEHEKMREDLQAVRNVAREQFKKAKKEIENARGSNPMRKVGSSSELVGLCGILQENQSESWMHVSKMLESLKTTVDTVCTKADDILLSSRISLCDLQQDLDLSAKLEDIVIQSVFRSLQEELEENLWEQNARFYGIQNVNWLEKFNDISSLGTQLDEILNLLSIPETGLVSQGSHDLDHLHQKAFSNHVTPSTSHYGENGTLDESNIHVVEGYDFQQLKHMSGEELVNYFSNIITKMRRDHESALQQKTEEYFCLRREYLKQKRSFTTHRKDEEFDVLRKKIPDVISKFDDFLSENERFPALTHSLESMGKLKHRLESLLTENRQLRDCLTDKKNELKCLEAEVSGANAKLLQRSLAEENLKSALEDSRLEASLNEEVYKCALREQIAQTRCDSEGSTMEFLITQEEAAIPAETAGRYEIEDSDIESLIMQGLSGLIFTEVIKGAEQKLNDLYRELKEKSVMDFSNSLSQEREQFELASQELSCLREHANQQQTLVTAMLWEFEMLGSQHLEALKQIEVDKMEMHELNQKLDQTKEVLTKANEEIKTASSLAQEMRDKLLMSEARVETLKKAMEMAANGLLKMFNDFECKVSGAIKKNSSRLEDVSSQLEADIKMANVLRRRELMFKQRLEQRCADLQMAEAEVDLLGDEVDTLLGLVEKIYIALDHYSPVLKHYPGIMEILELVRREVSGESTKLS